MSVNQNAICLAVIIVVTLLVGYLGKNPPNKPTGLLSLNENTSISARTYPLDDVQVYQSLPVGGKVLGALTVEYALNPKENEQEQVQELLTYARARAGASGANGVVVDMLAQRGAVWYLAAKVVEI